MTVAAPAKPRPVGKPIWPKIPAGFVRAVLAGHSALGLAFAGLIYLVCFSGTVAVFAHEFQRWEQAAGPTLTTASPAAIQKAAGAAVARFGGEVEHVYITPPVPDLPRLSILVDGAKRDQTYLADAQGELSPHAGGAVWTEFMTGLHVTLHLPQAWGGFVVGLTGVALLSSLISGLLAHPRVFKDAFHLRWGGSKRLQEADLHNRLGVWALPFHVLLSLTGALLGLTTVIVGVLALAVFQGDVSKAYDLFLPPQPKEDARPAPMPDIAAALIATQKLSPGSYPSFIGLEHPTERGQGVLINANQPNRLVAADAFTFDGHGKLLDADRTGNTTLGAKVLGAINTLHFGWFGGLAIKIAYGLLGVALTSVTASGVAIWLARRRDKGRPAPAWERIWIASVWSQPLAYGVSAVVGLLIPSPAIVLAVWGVVTVLSLALAIAVSPRRLSVSLRLASAASLVLVVLVHAALNAVSTTDAAAWGVDTAILGLAALLAWSVFKPKPAPATK
jgi:uncharacterized iron-regulated membrane protein